MHSCSVCGSEYPSSWAAAQCEDEDLERDAQTRSWFGKKDPNYRY